MRTGCRHKAWKWLPAACAAALAAGLLLLLHVQGKILRPEWLGYLFWLLPPALLLRRARQLWKPGAVIRENIHVVLPLVWLSAGALLYVFSSAALHRWFYFLKWFPETSGPHFAASGIERTVFLTALLWPFFLFGCKRRALLLLLVLLAVQYQSFRNLLEQTGGEALYRDDHPSFMFRLWTLGRTFPQLRNYSPFWNGGTVDFVGTTSGTSSVGLFLWPLWRWAAVHRVYTYAFGFVFIVVVPFLAFASLRVAGADRTAAAAAGLMALGVSQHYFLWLLHFGTIGACFTYAFLLPVAALAYRVVWLGRTDKRTAIALVIASFFLLQWPPGALIGAPLVLSLLFSARRWTRRKLLFLAACGLATLVLYAPTLLLMWRHGSDQMQYVTQTEAASASALRQWLNVPALREAADYVLWHMREANPLLIFLGIGGVFVLRPRSVRIWILPLLAVLGVLTGLGREWLPKMQLSRMAIPMMLVAVFPAALAVSRILRTRDHRLALARAAVTSLLVMGAWNVTRFYDNKGPGRFNTLTSQVRDLNAWIRETTPEDGRVLFAGATVHTYGRGHVAYLPVLTGREMMACDYYHFPTDTVEYNYPPRAFRQSPAHTRKFMDLYNVMHIVTRYGNWIRFFRQHPEDYREVRTFGGGDVDVTAFEVRRESSLFLRGNGTVRADFNRIDVRLEDPVQEAVIKYNWSDGLSAPEPVELFPHEEDEDVRLIGIRPHGQDRFSIRFRSRP